MGIKFLMQLDVETLNQLAKPVVILIKKINPLFKSWSVDPITLMFSHELCDT